MSPPTPASDALRPPGLPPRGPVRITIDVRALDELHDAGVIAEQLREAFELAGMPGEAAKAEQVCEILSGILVLPFSSRARARGPGEASE